MTLTCKIRHPFPVLVVEDNPVIQQQLKIILGKEGFEIETADNGECALDMMRDRFYPIIITDWMMPGMNGPELCRAIRDQDNPGYVFIILLTSKNSKGDIVQGLEAGADDYVSKPFDKSELVARINTGERILELEHSLKEANEEIRRLSITDPLTGCYNRAYLSERLPRELKMATRYGQCLSLTIFDIDHFKGLNDENGHLAGDDILRKVTALVKETVRTDVDWLVRYGGDEFLLIMPNTPISGAEILAERLREAICDLSVMIRDRRIGITASFGVTGIDMSNGAFRISGDSLINIADGYLYEAKKAGRNSVRAGDQVES
jgi:two-component system cell cycle response regulator